jgi:hypothetical protein
MCYPPELLLRCFPKHRNAVEGDDGKNVVAEEIQTGRRQKHLGLFAGFIDIGMTATGVPDEHKG